MNEKNSKINLSTSSIHFDHLASGIKFNYKSKKKNRQDYLTKDDDEEEEEEEKPKLNRKHQNKSEFRPGTKKAKRKNDYKNLKKKYDIEDEIDEKEEEELKDEDSIKKRKNETPPSRILKNIYTEKNIKKNNKIILDDDEEEEEENPIEINDEIVEEKPKKNKKNNKNKKKNKKDNKKDGKKDDKKDDEKDEKKDNKKGNKRKKKNKNEDNKASKKIILDEDDVDIVEKKYNSDDKGNKIIFNEKEFQQLLSESKNYLPFQQFDINKYLLTSSQINNIEEIPELSQKYQHFLSLKKKQDKIQDDILIKNILKNLKSICNYEYYSRDFRVGPLFGNQDWSTIEYKSYKKTAYFDLFICFISIYANKSERFIESTSIPGQTKLLIPLQALAYIYSSKLIFSKIAELIQSYYDKLLSYKIIPIYNKENEEYRHRINMRKIIWKQFETPYKYYKNNKKLYIKEEGEEQKLDENKIKNYSEEIGKNINLAYNDFENKIFEEHDRINEFDMNDERIKFSDNKMSAASSLYNQINEDVLFKLKMNLYKYKMKQMYVRKACKINDAVYKRYEFINKVKNKIFKQSCFYMNACDAIQDFLSD